ncbi:hypothetical protein AYI68_g4921 [Smittium mucronatum]|uniref:Ubiquitin-like domain-containing protein n=1 Tax=Smittium mucronatum TaxID=133383 RepID=A0A1R0GVV5_9FUNG|nr:hypothetical protein AYI68_g4921 [Smittium mucronatum]
MADETIFELLMKQLSDGPDRETYPKVALKYPIKPIESFHEESESSNKRSRSFATGKIVHPLNTGLELKKQISMELTGLTDFHPKLVVKGKNISDDKLLNDYEALTQGFLSDEIKNEPVIHVMSPVDNVLAATNNTEGDESIMKENANKNILGFDISRHEKTLDSAADQPREDFEHDALLTSLDPLSEKTLDILRGFGTEGSQFLSSFRVLLNETFGEHDSQRVEEIFNEAIFGKKSN